MTNSYFAKITSVIISIIMVTSMFLVTIINTSAYSIGDLNNDEKINAIDAIAMQQEILGKSTSSMPARLGDINGDGKINSTDDNLLKLVILGSYTISDNSYKVGTVVLGNSDLCDYSICLPEEYPETATPESAQYASEVLQKYIKKACGISLPITTNSVGNCISFEYDEELGFDAFTINVENGQVKLTCGTLRAPIYAAMGFLEEILGYRIYTRDVFVLDEANTISIESGYKRTEGLNTPFAYRDTYTNSRLRHTTYRDAHSSYYITSTLAHHNTGCWDGGGWINNPKYGYGYGPNVNHSTSKYIPHWRDYSKIACYSTQDNILECIEMVREDILLFLESGRSFEKGTMPMISISIDDMSDWCTCRGCRNITKVYVANSSTLIYFINTVSKELTPEFPDIKFWTLAYQKSLIAPTNMEIVDNLYICFAPIGHCSNHLIDKSECGTIRNDTSYDSSQLTRWLALTPNVHYWFYQCEAFYTAVPIPNLMELYYDFVYMAEVGVKGVFFENEETTLTFTDMYAYLVSEVLWNPDMSEDEYKEMAKQFCRDYYGSEELFDVLMLLDESGDRMGCWSDWTMGLNPTYRFDMTFLAEKYEYIFTTLETSRTKIEDAGQLERFDRACIGVKFITLTAAHTSQYVNGSDVEKSNYIERYRTMYDWFIEHTDSYYFAFSGSDLNTKAPSKFNPSVSPINWFTGLPK